MEIVNVPNPEIKAQIKSPVVAFSSLKTSIIPFIVVKA
jgi:hypothetical protein